MSHFMDYHYDYHDDFYGEDGSSYHPDADHEFSANFDDDDDDDYIGNSGEIDWNNDYREDFHSDEAVGFVDYREDGPYDD